MRGLHGEGRRAVPVGVAASAPVARHECMPLAVLQAPRSLPLPPRPLGLDPLVGGGAQLTGVTSGAQACDV